MQRRFPINTKLVSFFTWQRCFILRNSKIPDLAMIGGNYWSKSISHTKLIRQIWRFIRILATPRSCSSMTFSKSVQTKEEAVINVFSGLLTSSSQVLPDTPLPFALFISFWFCFTAPCVPNTYSWEKRWIELEVGNIFDKAQETWKLDNS